jgi:mono/diheme cytochrome c family protein
LKKSKLKIALVLAVAGVVTSVSLTVTGIATSSDKKASSEGFYTSFFKYSSATGNIKAIAESPPVTPGLIKYGEWTYRGLCIGCHGVKADGNGAVWTLADELSPKYKLPRKPRDFTEAVFKIRSTPSGSLPTDNDLFEAISRGLVADEDMPAFKFLPERDRWAVVAYLKTLSERWEEEKEYQEDPIEISEPPAPTEEMLVAGKGVYKEMKCAQCHGDLGKGDGPSAPQLKDDNDLKIAPRDFSDSSMFAGGSDPKSVYQTFSTGFDGTPMPSFADFLEEQQRWELVWYVMSLRPDWSIKKAQAELKAMNGKHSG